MQSEAVILTPHQANPMRPKVFQGFNRKSFVALSSQAMRGLGAK